MGTLMVACLLRLNDGSVQRVKGLEHVGKSAVVSVGSFQTEGLLVQFTEKTHLLNGPSLQYVPNTSCMYLEDPTIVSRHPERFYSKFVRDCGPEAKKYWNENNDLSYLEVCQKFGHKIKSMFVDVNGNEVD
jgi:hypothetical protein